MTVYVDTIEDYPDHMVAEAAKRHGSSWCHMWTDGDVQELHALAARIGLRRDWFQIGSGGRYSGGFPHYDLVPSKRALALRSGAVEKELGDWLEEKEARDKELPLSLIVARIAYWAIAKAALKAPTPPGAGLLADRTKEGLSRKFDLSPEEAEAILVEAVEKGWAERDGNVFRAAPGLIPALAEHGFDLF